MIIPDINLLIYAYNPEATEHTSARAWWETLLNSGDRVGLPWTVILGFVRLSTARGVLSNPATAVQALANVESWLAQPGVSILSPGSRHIHELKATLSVTSGGIMTTDAHLAALAIEYQAELNSNDSDFSRFPGLRWRNPLATRV
jgi:toxin-antitoxin system PIN domain toxin